MESIQDTGQKGSCLFVLSFYQLKPDIPISWQSDHVQASDMLAGTFRPDLQRLPTDQRLTRQRTIDDDRSLSIDQLK